MALTYDVDVLTTRTPENVMRLFEEVSQKAGEDTLWFSALAENDDLSFDSAERAFGFRPSVRVAVALGHNRDVDYRVLLRAVNELLKRAEDKLVLLFNGEFVEIQRLGAAVEVNTSNEWFEGELEELTLPYELVEVRQPFLRSTTTSSGIPAA